MLGREGWTVRGAVGLDPRGEDELGKGMLLPDSPVPPGTPEWSRRLGWAGTSTEPRAPTVGLVGISSAAKGGTTSAAPRAIGSLFGRGGGAGRHGTGGAAGLRRGRRRSGEPLEPCRDHGSPARPPAHPRADAPVLGAPREREVGRAGRAGAPGAGRAENGAPVAPPPPASRTRRRPGETRAAVGPAATCERPGPGRRASRH